MANFIGSSQHGESLSNFIVVEFEHKHEPSDLGRKPSWEMSEN